MSAVYVYVLAVTLPEKSVEALRVCVLDMPSHRGMIFPVTLERPNLLEAFPRAVLCPDGFSMILASPVIPR